MGNITSTGTATNTQETQISNQDALLGPNSKAGTAFSALATSAMWGGLGNVGETYRPMLSGNGQMNSFDRTAYNNAWVAGEFMLASKLAHVALKSLGFKPPIELSLAVGFAATVLIESKFDLTNLAVSDTLSKAVISPIVGGIVSAGVFIGIPAGLLFCFGISSSDPTESNVKFEVYTKKYRNDSGIKYS